MIAALLTFYLLLRDFYCLLKSLGKLTENREITIFSSTTASAFINIAPDFQHVALIHKRTLYLIGLKTLNIYCLGFLISQKGANYGRHNRIKR